MIGSIWILGCGGGDKPSELVGHWVRCEGATRGVPEDIELFKDGTGVVDKGSVTWKVETKRLALLSSNYALACDYKVLGYELILVYDENKNALFVKKENLKEYEKKKEDERKKKEEEEKMEEERKIKEDWKWLEKKFGSFTDSRNNHKYRTIEIGGMTWMTENLNYQTSNSWCYEDDSSNCDYGGRLYDWTTAKTVCPSGWHLPSHKEWENLVNSAGGSRTGIAGRAFTFLPGNWKDTSQGTVGYGFFALPGIGTRRINGSFSGAGFGGWWTSTDIGDCCARSWYVGYDGRDVLSYGFNKLEGLSVRCVRD